MRKCVKRRKIIHLGFRKKIPNLYRGRGRIRVHQLVYAVSSTRMKNGYLNSESHRTYTVQETSLEFSSVVFSFYQKHQLRWREEMSLGSIFC